MQACNCQGICIISTSSESVFTNYIFFFHFFSFPRSSIDTIFFQCLPIFFLNWFQGRNIGNLQVLLTLVPYNNRYRSTHPPTFQWTVVLIKKKCASFASWKQALHLIEWWTKPLPSLPTPPPPTPPPRLVFYYLYINHLIDKGQYFQLEET